MSAATGKSSIVSWAQIECSPNAPEIETKQIQLDRGIDTKHINSFTDPLNYLHDFTFSLTDILGQIVWISKMSGQ